MTKPLLTLTLCLLPLLAQESTSDHSAQSTQNAQEAQNAQDTQSSANDTQHQAENPLDQGEMTHAQALWGRKFQAGLGYTYFNTGHHGLQLSYGMWDLNKMGIQAEIFFPLTYAKESKIYLVTFYWIAWDWAPIDELSIIPKIGYGPKIYDKRNHGQYLSWEPTMSLDLSYNINSFTKLYASYTWAMFKDERSEINHLHGVSAGVRIAY